MSMVLALVASLAFEAKADGMNDTAPVLRVEVVDAQSGRAQIELWSLEQLCDLPVEALQTSTPWTSGVQDFAGVALNGFLDRIGVSSGEVELQARNDYSVTTTVEDLRAFGAVLAYKRNDALMSPRDKGPLWMVFAYDTHQGLRREEVYALSVWQLDRIRISR